MLACYTVTADRYTQHVSLPPKKFREFHQGDWSICGQSWTLKKLKLENVSLFSWKEGQDSAGNNGGKGRALGKIICTHSSYVFDLA